VWCSGIALAAKQRPRFATPPRSGDLDVRRCTLDLAEGWCWRPGRRRRLVVSRAHAKSSPPRRGTDRPAGSTPERRPRQAAPTHRLPVLAYHYRWLESRPVAGGGRPGCPAPSIDNPVRLRLTRAAGSPVLRVDDAGGGTSQGFGDGLMVLCASVRWLLAGALLVGERGWCACAAGTCGDGLMVSCE
jgi:hypothetical protein